MFSLVPLPLVGRPASGCGHFIHLLSVLSLRMLLFWMQTCLVTRDSVICRPPVTVAFTHHSHTDFLFLQRKPVFAYPSAARILFVSCFFVFSSYGCWDKWASHSQWLIEYDFGGGQGDSLTDLCLLVWNKVVYSPLSFSSFCFFFFPFSLFLSWLMVKSQRMK